MKAADHGVLSDLGRAGYHERASPLHLARAVQRERASPGLVHEVVFAVWQRGVEALEARLRDISDPTSPSFGMHMTHDEIAAVTNTNHSAGRVVEVLESRGATIVRSTLHGEYITASWTVRGWETLFSAEFYHFEHAGGKVVRATEYSLPAELQGHVMAVFNTVQVRLSPQSGEAPHPCSSWRGPEVGVSAG